MSERRRMRYPCFKDLCKIVDLILQKCVHQALPGRGNPFFAVAVTTKEATDNDRNAQGREERRPVNG